MNYTKKIMGCNFCGSLRSVPWQKIWEGLWKPFYLKPASNGEWASAMEIPLLKKENSKRNKYPKSLLSPRKAFIFCWHKKTIQKLSNLSASLPQMSGTNCSGAKEEYRSSLLSAESSGAEKNQKTKSSFKSGASVQPSVI